MFISIIVPVYNTEAYRHILVTAKFGSADLKEIAIRP